MDHIAFKSKAFNQMEHIAEYKLKKYRRLVYFLQPGLHISYTYSMPGRCLTGERGASLLLV